MGRIVTPTYRIEFTGGDLGRVMQWKPRQYGAPSADSIEKFIVAYVRSSRPGGTNEHLGKALGREIVAPTSAKIIRQNTGELVAEWKHPMFWVIP